MTKYFSVPAKELSYDVVVAGGGVAGVAAALNAARNGVKTALIVCASGAGGVPAFPHAPVSERSRPRYALARQLGYTGIFHR